MNDNNHESIHTEDLFSGAGAEIKDSVSHNSTKSGLYKFVSIFVLIVGFVSGIVIGNIYKIQSITYKYPLIKEGEEIVEHFNTILMLGIWFSSILVALLFWAIYCHLMNQETIISKIENMAH